MEYFNSFLILPVSKFLFCLMLYSMYMYVSISILVPFLSFLFPVQSFSLSSLLFSSLFFSSLSLSPSLSSFSLSLSHRHFSCQVFFNSDLGMFEPVHLNESGTASRPCSRPCSRGELLFCSPSQETVFLSDEALGPVSM